MSFLDLANVVSDFAEALPLSVVNPGPAVRDPVTRRVHTRPSDDVSLVGVVGSTWPIDGFKISQVTEGKHKVGGRHVFTVGDVLRVADERAGPFGTNGSIVTVDGNEFEVIIREDWTRGGFAKYIAVLIKRRRSP